MAARSRLVGALVAVVLGLGALATAGAATVPVPVVSAVHGRVMGWARTPPGWFAVYVDRSGGDWCGLRGASWWVALVDTSRAPDQVTSARRIGAAMCGNTLAWVRAGRFSDGRHREVAFMLWATPSIGATTYIYRVDGTRLARLATIPGDSVALRRGTVTVRYENSGRSPNGRTKNIYRFERGRYRLSGG
jgi:hypothetical protein